MAYRKRDSRSAYSSADAYRSLQSGDVPFAADTPNHASDEDVLPPSPYSPDYSTVNERTALTGPRRTALTGSRRTTADGVVGHREDSLRPPRPFFLGSGRRDRDEGDRGSWSSSATLEPASDSDGSESVGSAPHHPSLPPSLKGGRGSLTPTPATATTTTTTTTTTTRRVSANTNTKKPTPPGVIPGGSSKAARAAMRYAATKDRASTTTAAASQSAAIRVRPRARRSTLDSTTNAISDPPDADADQASVQRAPLVGSAATTVSADTATAKANEGGGAEYDVAETQTSASTRRGLPEPEPEEEDADTEQAITSSPPAIDSNTTSSAGELDGGNDIATATGGGGNAIAAPVPTSPSLMKSHAHVPSSGHVNTVVGLNAPLASPSPPLPSSSPLSSPLSLSSPSPSTRPPPSAFPAFPFQSHPGNPDPGTHIPGVPRRSSLDSFRNVSVRPTSSASVRDSQNAGLIQNNSAGVGSVYAAGYNPLRGSSSLVDLDRPEAGYVRDREREGTPTPPPFVGGNAVYRNSAAAAMSSNSALVSPAGDNMRASIPRTSSVPSIAMRAPFLSPASRPSSSVWSPPAYPSNPYYAYPPGTSTPPLPSLPYNSGPNPTGTGTPTQTQSNFFLPRRSKPPLPSSRLAQKLTPSEKPWLKQKERRARASWWLTLVCFGLGIAASAVVCYFGWTGVKWLEDGELCEVFRDDFESAELDGDKWVREVELGGFGNGEFQMTTNKPENLKLQNGQLYLIPTLTSDEIGKDAITNKGNYTLDGCTATSNRTACSASSDSSRGTVINPVKSARISTKGKAGITFGKVEVRAKNPRGDWLWPAVWMLPQDDSKYGKWPLGGEIDIMEARGNGPSYPAQGVNFVRSSLNYGPLPTLLTHLFGWWSNKRATYDKSFHTYAFEWTPDWMRFYVDDRLQAMMNVKMTGRGGKSFFERGDYPETARNGSDVQVVVQDVWSMNGGSRAAPFDQEFYLILDLATGGTSGWFPDGVGGKPWFDGSATAMRDFANAQDTWSATWPESEDDRAFRIDYVRMWKLGKC